jgi:hypothetical protein
MTNVTLIFGGTGQTGRYCAPAALDKGDRVVMFVRNPDKVPADIKGRVELVIGDYTNLDSVRNVVKACKPTAIIVATALPWKAKKTPFNSVAVPEIMKTLKAENRERDVRLIYLAGAFSNCKAFPSDWLTYILASIMVPIFGTAALQEDNNLVIQYLLTSTENFNSRIVLMPYVIDAASKGTIIGSRSITRATTTFRDVADFLIRLGRDEKNNGCECMYIQYDPLHPSA